MNEHFIQHKLQKSTDNSTKKFVPRTDRSHIWPLFSCMAEHAPIIEDHLIDSPRIEYGMKTWLE